MRTSWTPSNMKMGHTAAIGKERKKERKRERRGETELEPDVPFL